MKTRNMSEKKVENDLIFIKKILAPIKKTILWPHPQFKPMRSQSAGYATPLLLTNKNLENE